MQEIDHSPLRTRRSRRANAGQTAAMNDGPDAFFRAMGLREATENERGRLDRAARLGMRWLERRRRVKRQLVFTRQLTRTSRRSLGSARRRREGHARSSHATRGSPDPDGEPKPSDGRSFARARHLLPLPDEFARQFGDLPPDEQLAEYLTLSAADAQLFAEFVLDSTAARRAVAIGEYAGLRSAGAIAADFVADLRRRAA